MTEHAHGFKHDFPQLIARRRVLGLLTGALAGLPTAGFAASCVADAAETAGPFPADGTGRLFSEKPNVLIESGVIREDLRQSFAGLTGTADGTPLTLELELVNASGDCAPLAGYAIYIWHCDALGAYSIYEVEDQNFLRGVGVTDAAGKVRFTTIFPGCYASRYPHIHFEVFASADKMSRGRDSLLISQLAFAEADCRRIYDRDPAYANGSANLARNSFAGDMIFRNDSAAQTRQRTIAIGGAGDGVTGTARIGIDV